MGYMESNLMTSESVVFKTRLHWIVYKGPVICMLLAIMAFISGKMMWGFGGVFLFVAFFWGGMAFLDTVTSEYGVTNKRVMIKIGVIRRVSLETLLEKIEGIQVDQGILGRILGYGTIYVRGTGGTSNPFKSIKDPIEFRKKVQEQIEAQKTK